MTNDHIARSRFVLKRNVKTHFVVELTQPWNIIKQFLMTLYHPIDPTRALSYK